MTSEVDARMVEDLLLGSQIGILSSTSTYPGDLERWAVDLVAERGPLTLVHPDEVEGRFGRSAMACCVGAMGSLQALQEIPPSGGEAAAAVRALEELVDAPVACIAPLTIGGLNCMVAIATAAILGLPILDCDGQGRVLPRIDQTTYALSGVSVSPLAAVGPWGDTVTLTSKSDRAEPVMRSSLNGMGGWLIAALYPAPAIRLGDAGIPNAITDRAAAGAILRSGRGHESVRIARQLGGRILGRRTVTDLVHRQLARAVEPGHQPAQPITMVLAGEDEREPMVLLEIRNEVVLALVDGAVVARVPDLVCLLDPLRQRFVDLSDVTVGDVVDVLVLPADRRWMSVEGLRLAGPTSFGLESPGGVR